MKIINLTPHEVVVAGRVFPPSGNVPRVAIRQVEDGDIDGIPIVRTEYGQVEGMPEPEEGTIYVVSMIVLTALKGTRQDVIAPDTSPASVIRDSEGRIVGVKRFTR